MNKKILFVINHYGMGNTTRCDSLIQLWQENCDIDVITSGRSFTYFQNHKSIKQSWKQHDLMDEKQSFSSKLVLPFYFFRKMILNFFFQRTIFKKKKYDFVIFDSDYSFVLHRLFRSPVRIVGLNNAYDAVRFFKLSKVLKQPLLLFSYFFEVLDMASYLIFSNYVLAPTLSSTRSASLYFKKLILLPPLARPSINSVEGERKSVEQLHVLAIGSSADVDSALAELPLLPENRFQFSILNRSSFQIQNEVSLKKADIIICNSGQSSLAECLYLDKPTITIPLKNHAEQATNADLASQYGVIQKESIHKITEEDLLSLIDSKKVRVPFSFEKMQVQAQNVWDTLEENL